MYRLVYAFAARLCDEYGLIFSNSDQDVLFYKSNARVEFSLRMLITFIVLTILEAM